MDSCSLSRPALTRRFRTNWQHHPTGIYTLRRMPTLTASGASKPADEKITINVSVVDLGHIDLLVQQGFYSNRSDLIRTAIRREISNHSATLESLIKEKRLVLGLQTVTASELEKLKARKRTLQLRVLGLLVIDADVEPSLALETIDSLTVLGAFHASPAVRKALADRIR